jgi:uncharacterized coiled-coil protein SlyX
MANDAVLDMIETLTDKIAELEAAIEDKDEEIRVLREKWANRHYVESYEY